MIDATKFGRARTILSTMEWMWSIKARTLLEIGTCRNLVFRTWIWDAINGDGRSTIAWGQYANECGLKIHTVDIDPEAIAFCKSITGEYAQHIEYHNADGEAFIKQFTGTVDAWYLDGVSSLRKRLRMAKAILPKMAPISLALFDDIHEPPPLFKGGFGSTVIPWMIKQGYRIIFAEQQQVLIGRGV